jgi:hypothetical protein
MTQDELNEILDQLIVLGGNKDELEMWRVLYPTLAEDKKMELDKNLSRELNVLEKNSV